MTSTGAAAMEIDGNATQLAARCVFGSCRVEACKDFAMFINLKIGMLHLSAAMMFASSNPSNRDTAPQPDLITHHQDEINSATLPKRVIVKDFSGLTPLDETAILNLIHGKKLSNTPDREFVGRLFVEEFEQSGIWIDHFSGRGSIRYGNWSVKADSICVSTPLRPELCRSIFIDQNTGEIWLSEYYSSYRNHLHKIFILNE
jgi:hypothetical protein